ncbi:MAG: hypothetical protein HQ581_29290, partial [Planctomycetes bacterium]|nr:hypothetical protein [Planctomycetota bacterium]
MGKSRRRGGGNGQNDRFEAPLQEGQAMHQGSSQIADELLVFDWQSGDERALRALFDRWHPRLVGYARRLTQSEDGAADVVQEAWLAMLRGIRRLEDAKTFPRW